jgi:hypothetical protein
MREKAITNRADTHKENCMKQATPAAGLLRLLLVFVLAACALPALAKPAPSRGKPVSGPGKPVKVKMRVISGGLAFYMPADAYNKPILSWDANLRYLVHVVVQSTGSQVVDETSGRAYLRGRQLTLCYRVRRIPSEKGAAADATAPFPEIMEFYIPSASTQNKYDIAVKRDCK